MAEVSEQKPARGKRKAFTIFFVVVLILGIGGLAWWLHSRQFEDTDDAQVDGHLNSISARIDGTVTKVYVENNQPVKVGDPLVDLDPRDYEVALSQALAQLTQAKSMVIAQEPNVPITRVENVTSLASSSAEVANAEAALAAAERDRESSAAQLDQTEANNAKAHADLVRYQKLIVKEEVSQQEFDQVATTAKAQAAAVVGAKAALASAGRVVEQRQAQVAEADAKADQVRRTAPQQIAIREANVQSERASAQTAQAQVEQARLKLSYCKIVSPVAGIVVTRSAELGAHVGAGQQLIQIAQTSDLWVTANFKETQLAKIRKGDSVRIHVDATDRDYDGVVQDIGGATGAVSSILPPENATGNYVKVVQRIPVRIAFKAGQNGMELLRPGMSVEPTVRLER